MSFVSKAYYQLKGICLVIFLCMTLTPILPVMCIVWLILRPFSQVAYLKFASWLQWSWLSVEVFIFEDVCGIKIRMTGDMPAREPALCISNHLSHDYVMIYSLAHRVGTLGQTRALIKNSIKYIPFLGPAINMCYWPFVTRNFQKDIRNLKKLFGLYSEAEMPAQIWIFPEGTRMAADKKKASQEYAKAKGYPVWENVLLPKYRGFCTALDSMKDTFQTIRDVTIQFEGWECGVPGFWDMITSDSSPKTLHIHIVKHKLSDVPDDEPGRQKWLIDRFQEKETLIEGFKKNKQFPGKSLMKKYPLSDIILHPLVWGVGAFSTCLYAYLWLSSL